jgi:hypothetical protein
VPPVFHDRYAKEFLAGWGTKEELEYFREVGLHDTVTVTYAALAMSTARTAMA